PMWAAYGQFVRTFLLPLLAYRNFGVSLGPLFLGQRDGLEPETVYKWAGWLKRLTPPFLGLVSFPKWLGSRGASDPEVYKPKRAASADQARYIVGGLLKNCHRQLSALEPKSERHSKWS